MNPPITLTTGAARSGTSLVQGILHACGLPLGGPLVGPSDHNPRGFFEHRRIRQKVLKPLLRSLGADPRGQAKLPPRNLVPDPVRVRKLREDVLTALNGARGYKDAKIILTWQYWRAAFPDAIWILVRRDPKAIVDSCIRTPFMRKRKYKAGWIEWVQEHEFRFADLKASGAHVVEIWPDPADIQSFRPAVEACGLHWDPGKVQGMIVASAWHERKRMK